MVDFGFPTDTFIAPDSIIALIWYALWAVVLVLAIGAMRFRAMRGGARITNFTAGERHGSNAYWRLYRAHANTLENLPIFAAIVLSGWVVGMQTKTFNQLAVAVLIARIVQSVIHIASGHPRAIMARFIAFAVQIVCMIWMAILVLQRGGGL